MGARTNRQWLFKGRPTAQIGTEHFEWHETTVPDLVDGQVLVRSKLLSIDAANRAWMNGATYRGQLEGGSVMDGFALGEIVESTVDSLKPGDVVEGSLGWQDYAVLPAKRVTKRNSSYPLEMLIGPLGITGLTAYYGVLDVARVKTGETFLVSGAAGAVGSIAGQIARLAGCRVIGTAGGQDKCDWLVRELGFDAAVDYKAGNVRRQIKAIAPEGIDTYFDNTGGEVLDAALALMNLYGRIACCGNVSQYNVERPGGGAAGVPGFMVTRRIRMEGFVVMDHFNTRAKAEAQLAAWLEKGAIKAPMHILDGLDKAPGGLVGMFAGENRGKMAIRIA